LGALFATQIVQKLSNNSTPEVIHTVNVPGDVIWYNTRIQAYEGQALTIVATGNVSTLSGEDGTVSGPDGQITICPDKENPEVAEIGCAMNSEPYGALIGKIGDSAPFRAGLYFSDEIKTNGILYFTVNDNYPYYEDNQGGYSVTITLR
jgi:hypothetical protein